MPQGTLVVQAESQDRQTLPEDPNASENRWFVIRDRPELSGDDIRNPEQNFDPNTNQPNVTFDFTDEGRQAFQDVTRRIAQRGLAEAPPGVAGNAQLADSTRGTSRSSSTARSSPGRSSTSSRTRPGSTAAPAPRSRAFSDLSEAQDLAEFLRIGALPIELKLISRARSRRPSASRRSTRA